MADGWAEQPELPEGSILEWEVRLFSYITPDGLSAWGWTLTEGVSMTELLGMQQRFSHYLAHRAEGDDHFNFLFNDEGGD